MAGIRAAALLKRAVLVAGVAAAGGCGGHGPAPRQERVLYLDGPNGRYLLDSGWTARADPRDVGLAKGWQRPGFGTGFGAVHIPDAFNRGSLSARAFASRVEWYRVRFSVPDVAGTNGWNLRFEGVSGRAEVFFRGRRIGSNDEPFLPFEVHLAGATPGSVEVVVRVDGRRRAVPLPPASRPAGWWNYTGIVREVYLRRIGAFDLANLHVIAKPGTPARVRVTASARNSQAGPARLDYEIAASGPAGFTRSLHVSGPVVAPGGAAPISASFAVPRPRLWAPGHPWLYIVRVTVPGGQVTQQQFGIRSFTVDRSGRLLLNGRRIRLRGASFHEMTRRAGSALSPADRVALVSQLRSLGANVTREHYPPHPALLEAFDRLGIVFWEQIPVWRVSGLELRPRALRPVALDYLRRALLRDRNHPSVAVLSVSNETLRGGGAEAAYISAAHRTIRRLAPGMLAAADAPLTPLSRLPASYATLDAIGVTSYLGWYRGAPSELGPALDSLRRRYPRQALVVTELGAEANRSGPAGQKGTYAFQRNYLDRELSIGDSRAYLSGALVWLLRDFPARPGWVGGNPRPRPPINAKGLFRADGTRKPAFATVRRLFIRALGRTP
jgi:beta-glucuronidase